MSIMEAFGILGIFSALFSVIVFSMYLSDGEERAKEAAWGVICAQIVFIALGASVWLVNTTLSLLTKPSP